MSAAPPDRFPLKGVELFLAALVLTTANFIAVLDLTIANVSVPNIAGSLGVSVSQGTWIITSYAVAEAIIVPLTGWLAGRFGPVRVFSAAILMFGLASALCGLSQSFEFLVLFRIVQGLAGGLIMPLSQVLLLRVFPKEQGNFAIGIWAMTSLTAPVMGPIAGGFLCDNFGWSVIFLVNVPLALVMAPLAFRLQQNEQTVRKRIDLVGLGLLIVFVAALQLMLSVVRCPKPVIARVHGIATAAGCQLVASCDLAIAAEEARFATPGVNIGLFCSTPMVALSRNLANKHAMEMLLTGELLPAAEAWRMGLVNRVVPAAQLDAEVAAWAAKIAAKSGSAIAIGKRAYYEQAEMGLEAAYRYAAAVMQRNLATADAAEGIDAFLQKRPACWVDR